jgi:HK97 family phage portal protein
VFLSNGTLVTKTPLNFTSSSWFPYMPPMSSPTWPSAYAGIYERQLWVYVVVNKLAKATARLPFIVYERDELNRPRADDHPLAELVRNPHPGLSWFDLMLWTSSTWDIYGDTFWLKQRNPAGRVIAVAPLHPAYVVYDAKSNRWSFDNGSTKLDGIRDRDLVRFRSFAPTDATRGMSPLEPLRATLENEWSARTATSSFWQRGARPGLALEHPGTLSDGAQDRLKRQFDADHAGADKTGVTTVLEEGMKAAKLDLTAEEAQYIETRKLNREEVCAAYDIPPPVVHILDHATFSNITEQMRSMYRDTMAPRLKAIEAAVEVDLRMAEWPQDDVYAEFLMDEVLRGDFETRQTALQQASHMTIAEKRRIENLPFIDGTDRIFLNTATMPLDAIDAQAAAIAGDAAPADDEPDEASESNVVPLTVARTVVGRLSWQKTLADVDEDALVADLAERDAAAVLSVLDEEITGDGSVKSLRSRVLRLARATPRVTIKAPSAARDRHERRIRDALNGVFGQQKVAAVASGQFTPSEWDDLLTTELHAATVDVSSKVGRAVMRDLDASADGYDIARTLPFLESVSKRLARNINRTTKAKFDEAKADPDRNPAEVFDAGDGTRANGVSIGVATLASSFAVAEAGKQLAESEGVKPTKTWIVTSRNPRPEHAALSGETVGIDDNFSNGLAWPGDGANGDAADIAGCQCDLEITF